MELDARRASENPAVQEAWLRYKTDGDRGARGSLITAYMRLVSFVASKVHASLPNTIEHDDLVSYGTFGLIDAIEKFDLGRGLKFETYAISRIRGSIIDELRTLDWVPRSIRSLARDLDKVAVRLEGELGRAPTESEIADALGVSVQELWSLTAQAATVSVTTLDEGSNEDEDRVSLAESLPGRSVGDPEGSFATFEVQQMLARAVNRMPPRSKTILALYYLEEMTLADIGRVLGVTESRVCQLHTKAVLGLRSELGYGLATDG